MKKTLLFKITKRGKTSHLFGTIHLGIGLNDIPDIVLPALESAQRFVSETNLPENLQKIISDLCMPWMQEQTSNIQDLNLKKINILNKIAPLWKQHVKHLNLSMFSNYPPIYLLHLIILHALTSVYDSKLELDNLLRQKAVALGIEISELEEVSFQIKTLFGLFFDYDNQCEHVSSILDSFEPDEPDEPNEYPEYSITLNKDLKKAYLDGNLAQIDKLFKSIKDKIKVYSEILRKHDKALMDDRDITMTNKIMEHLEKGDAFIAVGAAHLSRIIKILIKAGYTVEQVYTSCLKAAPVGGHFTIKKYEEELKSVLKIPDNDEKISVIEITNEKKEQKFMVNLPHNQQKLNLKTFSSNNSELSTKQALQLIAHCDCYRVLTTILKMINHFNFKLNHGGKKIREKYYSHAAADIKELIEKTLDAGEMISYRQFHQISEEIKAILRGKMVTTAGLFGLWARDQTTVTLYEDILITVKTIDPDKKDIKPYPLSFNLYQRQEQELNNRYRYGIKRPGL